MTESEMLKNIREVMGLNPEEFADALGLQTPELISYESGGKDVPREVLDRAYLLNFSVLDSRFDDDA